METATHVKEALSKMVQTDYLGVNTETSTPSNSGRSLDDKIQQAYSEMCRLIKLREQQATLHSQKGLAITEEWYSRTLPSTFPEFASLVPDKERGILVLTTFDAPMYWVYNGINPFYISRPHLGYKFSFSPTGLGVMRSKSREIEVPGLHIQRSTHPHNSGGGSSGFNDLCTGPNNPFFSHLTSRQQIKSTSDFKRCIALALRWLRTYNVNDSFNTSVYSLIEFSSSARVKVANELLGDHSDPVRVVLDALLESYRYLQVPSGDILSQETVNGLAALAEDFSPPASIVSYLDGIKCLLRAATDSGAQESIQEGTQSQLNSSLAAASEHNPVAAEVFNSSVRRNVRSSFPRVAKYLFALDVFQALYQIVLIMGRGDESFQLCHERPFLSLLFRDMADSVVLLEGTTNGGYPRMFINRLLARRFEADLQTPGAVQCEAVFEDYTELIDNLFRVLPIASLKGPRKHTWMGHLLARYEEKPAKAA